MLQDIFGGEYDLFSPDLSLAVVEPTANATPLLSPEATERTLYLRDNASDSFTPLVMAADVPQGTHFGGEEAVSHEGELTMRFITATPDLGHVIFGSPLAMTREAVSVLLPSCEYLCGAQNLYEWGDGRLQLVNILPNGKPTNEPNGAHVAGEGEYGFGMAARTVSDDGRWVAWTYASPYTNSGLKSYKGLFIRDMIGERTVKVGGQNARYQTMSSDGSEVFFIENGDLYDFNTNTKTQVDLTSDHGPGEANGGVKETVSDVSEDGGYVYFVATGVLANGGVGGEDNLYLLHNINGEWSTRYIATLSNEDEKDYHAEESVQGGGIALTGVSSRVSPDGRFLAFMSNRSLTGYDNIDVNSSQPDEEVYLYDAESDRLVCASCNPTGARPTGVLDGHGTLLVDRNVAWSERNEHWLAGNIPTWDFRGDYQGLHQPRYLSDSGRLFFDSSDALVPQDTNSLEDVYEYEPLGVGNCEIVDITYSEHVNGCVDLISSGTSASESVFYDASENGDDVFFLTSSRLVATDYDTSNDVYDAHVCSGTAPCISAPVTPPPCTSGDSCKAAPSPQPEIFGSPPSATFSGAGNVFEATKKGVVKHRSKAKRKSEKRTKKKIRKARRTSGRRKVTTGRKAARS